MRSNLFCGLEGFGLSKLKYRCANVRVKTIYDKRDYKLREKKITEYLKVIFLFKGGDIIYVKC